MCFRRVCGGLDRFGVEIACLLFVKVFLNIFQLNLNQMLNVISRALKHFCCRAKDTIWHSKELVFFYSNKMSSFDPEMYHVFICFVPI